MQRCPSGSGCRPCGAGDSIARMSSPRKTQRPVELLGVLLFLATGCMSMPTDTSLQSPHPLVQPIAQHAWLAPVEIRDSLFTGKKALTVAGLTVNIQKYLLEGRYFDQVGILPGEVSEGDVILKFEFDDFRNDMRVHPAYFPLAFITATLYIWVGGPIWVAKQNLSATLRVEDSNGSLLAEPISETIRSSDNITFYDPFPSGIASRTDLIRALLNQAVANLRIRKD